MIQVKTKSLEFHKYTNRIHQHFQLHELQGLLDETPLERTPEISHSKVMCIKNRKKKRRYVYSQIQHAVETPQIN